MSAARRFLLPAELSSVAVAAPQWPLWSLGLLVPLTLLLPLALGTVLCLLLLALATVSQLAGRRPLPPALLRPLLPLAGLLLVGAFVGAGAEPYVWMRDAWYIVNPALYLAVGFVLARQATDAARGLRALLLGCTVVALLHLSWLLRHPELLGYSSVEVRTAIGPGFFAPVLALLLLLSHWRRWREGLRLPTGLAVAIGAVNAGSLALSYSRTLSVVFVVGALAALGFLARHEGRRLLLLSVLALAAVFTVRAFIDPASREAELSMIGKFGRSFEEMRVTQQLSRGEIERNWRGWETARALSQWSDGGPARWLFGEGLGATVDMGVFQTLNRRPRDAVRFVPNFHNGYVFVLVKTGLFGAALFIWFLWRLYQPGRLAARQDDDAGRRSQGRLLQGCVAALSLSTLIWFGLFHKVDLLPMMLTVGFLLATLAGTSSPTSTSTRGAHD